MFPSLVVVLHKDNLNKKVYPKKNLYFISYASPKKASYSLLQLTSENVRCW
jgi:hypothetical protein